jgi:DNA-binding GntR family transcriptional regulator
MLSTQRRPSAVDTIAGWIVGGRFGPGDTLPIEPAMGDELAVSRTVVREALKTLTAKGLVVTDPASNPGAPALGLEPFRSRRRELAARSRVDARSSAI